VVLTGRRTFGALWSHGTIVKLAGKLLIIYILGGLR
jgi:hypothetical protein